MNNIWLYLSLKNKILLILSEIVIDIKKNITLKGNAEDKKKTPQKNDFSPISNLFFNFKFFKNNSNIYLWWTIRLEK